MKEYKVGQIVTIKGTKCRVTKSDGSCDGCVHRNSSDHCGDNKGEYECIASCRSDGNNVIFKPIASTSKASNKQSDVITPKHGNNSLDASRQLEFPLPPKNMQVWIRGNKERGKDVIKMLTDLGAENTSNYLGDDVNTIYSIDKCNQINWLDIYSNTASLIANFYKEIKLPWRPKDKELVWAWDDEYPFARRLGFYDGKNSCIYSGKGEGLGFYYNHYAPYEGEYPQWAKDAQKKLED